MTKKLALIFTILLVAGCCVCKKVQPSTNTFTTIHVVDSIAWHDSTIYHTLYKEYYNDYTSLLDTLKLETSYSQFKAYVDSTAKLLKGEAKNKEIQIPEKIKWKEKIVYKDTTIIKEVPVPYEVTKEITRIPKSYWIFLGFSVLCLIYFGVKIYLKFKI